MIKREKYINKIKQYKNKSMIKVLTGLRRVGKSVLLDLYIDELKKEYNVKDENIIKINFELPENFRIKNYEDLTNLVLKWSEGKKGDLYVMLDEVGRVSDWEKAVNGLHSLKKFDIYITGSNADLLSSDLSTYLAGRYIEILIHPFSYKEFKDLNPQKTFQDYIVFGGMPAISEMNYEYDTSMTILRDSFKSAVFQDIVSRNNIRNTVILDKLIQYIFTNCGQTFSALSISKYFKSQKIKVSVDTVLSYLDIISRAFLIYKSKRYDLIGKATLKTEEKYYIADHGIREAIAGKNMQTIELILENIVFIELIRRGYEVSIGKINSKEIDFIAKKGNNLEYYQVTYLLTEESTRKQEFDIYQSVQDNYPKYVLSLDDFDFSQNGVIHKNIENFLLEE